MSISHTKINHSADIKWRNSQENKTIDYTLDNVYNRIMLTDFDYKQNQIGQLVAKLNRRQQAWSDKLRKTI